VIRMPATILVATAPVDMRMSFDRLAGIVRERLGAEPRRDTLVVFHNRVGRTHVKLLWHDGSG
jgi:transposase